MKKDHKGFSLVEIIIVIAIMAVLIGLLSPMYLKHVEKSKQVVDVENMNRTLELAQIEYAGGSFQPGDVAFVNSEGKLTTEKPAKGVGKAKSANTQVHFEVGCCEQGAYQDTENHKDDYLVVIFPSDENETIHVHWLEEAEATQIATSGIISSGSIYAFGTLRESSYDATGNMSLAKALISGRDSRNLCKSKTGEQYSLSELFGIDNFVNNYGVNNTELSTWLNSQELETASSYVKVVTSVEATGDTLTNGEIYKATQYLYYGNDTRGVTTMVAYGERDVYAKCVNNSSACKWYWDEECTQEINIKTNTDWVKSE